MNSVRTGLAEKSNYFGTSNTEFSAVFAFYCQVPVVTAAVNVCESLHTGRYKPFYNVLAFVFEKRIDSFSRCFETRCNPSNEMEWYYRYTAFILKSLAVANQIYFRSQKLTETKIKN